MKAVCDPVWPPFHSCHRTFPIFCSYLDVLHSGTPAFLAGDHLPLPILSSSFPATCPPRKLPVLVFCPHTRLTWTGGCCARPDDAEAKRMGETGGNNASEKHPDNSIHCTFCKLGGAWLEGERISRIMGSCWTPTTEVTIQNWGVSAQSDIFYLNFGQTLCIYEPNRLSLPFFLPHLSVWVECLCWSTRTSLKEAL